MGSHDFQWQGHSVPVDRPIRLLSVQAWPIAGKTNVTAFITQDVDGKPYSTNIGAEVLDYALFELPTLGQIIWCLGDELRESWRELSHPKR